MNSILSICTYSQQKPANAQIVYRQIIIFGYNRVISNGVGQGAPYPSLLLKKTLVFLLDPGLNLSQH